MLEGHIEDDSGKEWQTRTMWVIVLITRVTWTIMSTQDDEDVDAPN